MHALVSLHFVVEHSLLCNDLLETFFLFLPLCLELPHYEATVNARWAGQLLHVQLCLVPFLVFSQFLLFKIYYGSFGPIFYHDPDLVLRDLALIELGQGSLQGVRRWQFIHIHCQSSRLIWSEVWPDPFDNDVLDDFVR